VGEVDVHADPRLEQVDCNESDDQSDGGKYLEVYQCLERDTSDLRHVGHARDAVDDGAENDWSDQNADGFDESITERLHASAEVGIKVSQRDADRHCDQHLKPQLQIPRLCLLLFAGRRAVLGLHLLSR
jgi:hypothetical protein